MVKQNNLKSSGKNGAKDVKGKKRRADTALEKETGEDEFFLASDQEDNGAEEDDAVQETAEQKRLRLGEIAVTRISCHSSGSKKYAAHGCCARAVAHYTAGQKRLRLGGCAILTLP